MAKVELIRLLYLVLKKSLPSLGIDKKRVILEGLETIQIVTGNSELL